MKKVIGIFLTVVGTAMAILTLIIKIKGQMSVSIGGADGPTSVFVAGKVGNSSVFIVIVLLAAGIFMIIKKR